MYNNSDNANHRNGCVCFECAQLNRAFKVKIGQRFKANSGDDCVTIVGLYRKKEYDGLTRNWVIYSGTKTQLTLSRIKANRNITIIDIHPDIGEHNLQGMRETAFLDPSFSTCVSL